MAEMLRCRFAAAGGTITAMTADNEVPDEDDRAARLASELGELEAAVERKRAELVREIAREVKREVPKTALERRTGYSTKTLLRWLRDLGKAPAAMLIPADLRRHTEEFGRHPPTLVGAALPQPT